MPREKQPWAKLYTGDILADESLKSCSLAARGLFLYLFALMHRSVRKGFLCQENGQPWTNDQLSRMAGCSTDEVDHLLQELITSGVFSVSADGTGMIFYKRMVKEARIGEVRREAGQRGALAKHLPQQKSGKQGGKPSGKQGGKPLKSDSSSFVDEDEEKQEYDFSSRGVGVQGEGILPQQNFGKTASPDDALNAAALRCTVEWLAVLVTRKDDPAMCAKTFKAMLEEGIPEADILSEISLGPKTTPTRKRSEWLNQFYDRLARQLGFTSKIAGVEARSLAAGPAPVGASAPPSDFAMLKREAVKRVPGMPKDTDFFDYWEKDFIKINATGEEMLYALECYLDDPRRQQEKTWSGVFVRNAKAYLLTYIKLNRDAAHRAAKAEASAARKEANPEIAGEPALVPFAADPECIAVANALVERIGEPRFKLWFAGKTRLTHVNTEFHVGVPNLFLKDWLRETFLPDIRFAVEKVASSTGSAVKFVIDPDLAAAFTSAHGNSDNEEPPQKVG